MKAISLALTAILLIAGGAVFVYIVNSEPPSVDTSEEHAGAPAKAEYERGPHNGRLLRSGDLELEITIFESGIPPEFHIFPYSDGKPLPPDDVQLTIDLHRFGGRTDRIAFVSREDYLLGQQVVEEPHSFDVDVKATYNGQSHDWQFASYEGRTTMAEAAAVQAGVEFAVAGPISVNDSIELPGEIALDADRLVHITPRLSGVAREVKKAMGDKVQANELLAVIDSKELADIKSEYLAAVERQELAQARYKIESDLHAKKISADQELLQARQVLAEAGIAVRSAKQKLESLGLPDTAITSGGNSLTHFELRSPINGTIIEKHLALGEAVQESDDCFVIADLSNVWVKIVVYATDLKRLRPGQKAVVRSADLDISAEGAVSFIGDLVGQETRTAHAIVNIPNPEGLWRPGLYVTVELVDDAELELPIAVPADAIQEFRDWSVVFMRDGDLYEICPIELGRNFGDWVEVTSGLEAGVTYVSKNSYLIKADIEKSGATHDH
ncbi:MAG: efflux RND transporter periplasmic adaptor subunit [Candidatus Hydrogenedentes bacterium]|nr:efflux RND transporter periplasmic adaptor subunit [Candidatus Hydrogenedentota bacterium]